MGSRLLDEWGQGYWGTGGQGHWVKGVKDTWMNGGQ